MRVICIRDVYLARDLSQKTLYKGSIYNITNIINANDIRPVHLPNGMGVPEKGEWYELLETGSLLHHESHFIELPNDFLETEIKEHESKSNN